jgi:hypothetical protein
MENSKAKRQKFGFDVIPGGYVQPKRAKHPAQQEDPRNAWDVKPLGVHPNLTPGHFTIWTAASDVDGHTATTGPSACVWRIRGQGVDITESWPGRASESSEKKAYVAAAAGAMDRLPAGSTAEIICREKYIVDAINGGLADWFNTLFPREGEMYPRRPYGLTWMHFLKARERVTSERISQRSEKIKARRPEKDSEDDKIIEELRHQARNARPKAGV